uniref:ADAMTS/ADAMTS-like cysteine-rich domain-containing protein n=1 Tax=Terrapene triunguis TaxID=2587831 RepID=A0A674ID19_9SAUR
MPRWQGARGAGASCAAVFQGPYNKITGEGSWGSASSVLGWTCGRPGKGSGWTWVTLWCHPPGPGRGEWGPWGTWSACSSTCGDGASFRTRKCIRESCWGVCGGCECPGSSVPFRAVQCSLYDGKPIPGSQARYQWVPFHGAPNLCDLNCLAVGHNFYYTFGRVLDGTRCSPDSPDLCISGQCLTAGCDGLLGSGSRSDACGRCDSRNDSCLFVKRVFRAAWTGRGDPWEKGSQGPLPPLSLPQPSSAPPSCVCV